MKVVIIEDEKLSAEHLINLLMKVEPSVQIIDIFDSVKRAIDFLKTGSNADLLFLDIHLADGNSFEIFSEIATDTPLIFTTAYDEFAIRAFKLNSIDYLLKPIGKTDLQDAIDKYKRLKANNGNTTNINFKQFQDGYKEVYKSRFMVKLGETLTSVKSDHIKHFVFEDGRVLITTEEGKRYIIDYTLDQLEGLLSPESFFRINRKVILNINSAGKISTYFNSRLKIQAATLKDEEAVVSRERVSEFKKWLDK